VDLIGSAIGALLVASVLIPWLGFAGAGIVPGVLSLVTAFVALVDRTAIERSAVEVTS
jgi:predicted membrane-bound spermidine synthase